MAPASPIPARRRKHSQPRFDSRPRRAYTHENGFTLTISGFVWPSHQLGRDADACYPQHHHRLHRRFLRANDLIRLLLPPEYTAQFNHLFGLVPWYVTRRLFVWQLATYLFLHATIWHLVFNMLFLYFFGMDLERTWGTQPFLSNIIF